MNKVILMGRLIRDIEVRYSAGENAVAVGRYTLAVSRKFKRDGEADADFIPCIAFGRAAEFAEKYFRQGTKVIICGRIQTGSYTNREGRKIYTTEVVIEEQDFAESKKASTATIGENKQSDKDCAERQSNGQTYHQKALTNKDGFMYIPDGIEDELPFH